MRVVSVSRRLTGPVAAAVALVGCLLAGLVTAPVAQASDVGAFVSSINAARRSAGRAPLSTSGALASVARSWAASMASSGQLAHNPRLGSQVTGWRALAENVGVGSSTTSIHQAFMASSAHRANILSSRFTQVGVGVATGGGRMWVVEVFRLPSGASAPATSTTTKPKAPATTTRPRSRSKTITRTTTRRTTHPPAAPKPRPTATKPAPKTTASPRPADRAVSARPALDAAPLTAGAVLRHLQQALTASGDPVAAWGWLLRRLLGLRTALDA